MVSEAFETSAEPHRFMKRRRKGMYWMTEAPVQMVWKPCAFRLGLGLRLELGLGLGQGLGCDARADGMEALTLP